MELSPRLYHWFVRPKWFSHLCLNNVIKERFNLKNKAVLDFGCGVGSSCSICSPGTYIGVDCDYKRIQYARRLYPKYNFQVIENSCIPVADEQIDYILIVAVLHHISDKGLANYKEEFRRVLKPYGRILVIEPCMFNGHTLSNWFMNFFDKGKYIRFENEYMDMFDSQLYNVNIVAKYKQLLFYNKVFFTAGLKQ